MWFLYSKTIFKINRSEPKTRIVFIRVLPALKIKTIRQIKSSIEHIQRKIFISIPPM